MKRILNLSNYIFLICLCIPYFNSQAPTISRHNNTPCEFIDAISISDCKKDKLTLTSLEKTLVKKITIFDILGKSNLDSTLNTFKNIVEIDTHSLLPGIYYISIELNSGTTSSRIFKSTDASWKTG